MFKKSLTFILISSLLLLGCDFRPKHKIIEYQEEVKLSDGSFIWVDIKRHYWLSGGALGDAGNFSNASYMPGIVEISWDTGFEGVGRQSVFFDKSIDFIDKIDGMWYVVGQKYPYAGSQEGIASPNCQDIGVLINTRYQCFLRIDSQSNFIQLPIKAKDLEYIQMNILNTTLLRNDGNPMKEFLDKTKLSWSDKLELQKTQPKDFQLIGRPYSYHFINSSNGGEL